MYTATVCLPYMRHCYIVPHYHTTNSATAAVTAAAPAEPLVVTELTRPEHFSTLFALVEAQSTDSSSSSSSSAGSVSSSGSTGFDSVSVSNMAWDLLMRMPTNAAVLSKLLM
eukprot:8034-Heterococcus_DN1.PRE.2